MKKEDIKISIAVFTYNQQATIGRVLDFILNQKTTYSYEIVIGEDCSTDNTRKICEAYVLNYPNILNLLPKAENKGLLRNFRDVIAQCKGEYIAQCAGDDWWHNENKLQLEVDFLEQNLHIGMVHSDINLYQSDFNTTIISYNKHNCRTLPTGNYAHLLLGDIVPIYTPTPCYRRNLIEKVNLSMFIDNGWMMEDLPMWLEMSRYTDFAYIDQSLATYTAASSSACRPDTLEKHLKFEDSVTQVQIYYQQHYFQDICSQESIKDSDLKRKISVCRRFSEYRKAYSYYKQVDYSSSRLRTLSQKSYCFYRVLIFVKKIINKIR